MQSNQCDKRQTMIKQSVLMKEKHDMYCTQNPCCYSLIEQLILKWYARCNGRGLFAKFN